LEQQEGVPNARAVVGDDVQKPVHVVDSKRYVQRPDGVGEKDDNLGQQQGRKYGLAEDFGVVGRRQGAQEEGDRVVMDNQLSLELPVFV